MGMAANYGMTRVKFLKSWQGYNAGDVAGFNQHTAQHLVADGVAAFDKIEKPASTPVTKVQEPEKPAFNPKPKRRTSKKKTRKKYKVTKNTTSAVDVYGDDPIIQ